MAVKTRLLLLLQEEEEVEACYYHYYTEPFKTSCNIYHVQSVQLVIVGWMHQNCSG